MFRGLFCVGLTPGPDHLTPAPLLKEKGNPFIVCFCLVINKRFTVFSPSPLGEGQG
jgi:hypothetical protein